MTTDTIPAPILARDAVPIATVSPGWYSCVLQLGSGVRWRTYGPGRWVTDKIEEVPQHDPTAAPKRLRHVTMEPSLHRVEYLDHHTLNGLICHANRWILCNSSLPARASLYDREGRVNDDFLAGQISRQILVSDIQPSTPPPRLDGSDGRVDEERLAAAIVKALAACGVIAATASKGK